MLLGIPACKVADIVAGERNRAIVFAIRSTKWPEQLLPFRIAIKLVGVINGVPRFVAQKHHHDVVVFDLAGLFFFDLGEAFVPKVKRDADDRDFIRRTFAGIYFTDADLCFLDSAWSHIERMDGHKRALAISALVLSSARRQPRGVFTVTGLRYDDGRRDLRLPLRDHFAERAAEYNRVVFDSGQPCAATSSDVFDLAQDGFDVVYLDPPYAPPRDDNCYIKRYHFLEGLSVYWRDQAPLESTRTRKLPKRYTPFSYARTVTDALRRMIHQFAGSALVLSYSSNAVPDAATIEGLLREVKRHVEVRAVDHTYAFGTHQAARRRAAREYLFIAR